MKTWILFLLAVALLGAAITLAFQSSKPVQETGSIRVAFCPECEAEFVAFVKASGSLDCAIYDVGSRAGDVLAAASARVITDDETKPAYGSPVRGSGLMHNKFCTNGTHVFTGSYNPTDGGAENQNNVLIIESRRLAQNYEKQFQSLKSKKPRGRIQSDGFINGFEVENYFCPQDNCEDHVVQALSAAKEEVKFLTYSFTSDRIGELLRTQKDAGINVEGICEPSQNSSYSECDSLDALWYEEKGLLHHKVFIIDRSVVITGSYNPTRNADENNDENILIIHDAAIANFYLQEFDRLRLLSE